MTVPNAEQIQPAFAQRSGYLADAAGHPFTLGAVVGFVNGALAFRRDQFISLDVLAALAIPTVFAEAYLHWRSTQLMSAEERAAARSTLEVAAITGLGLVAGAALFTRWNPYERAYIESAQATPPSVVQPLEPIEILPVQPRPPGPEPVMVA